jgi:hypothetical protein
MIAAIQFAIEAVFVVGFATGAWAAWRASRAALVVREFFEKHPGWRL